MAITEIRETPMARQEPRLTLHAATNGVREYLVDQGVTRIGRVLRMTNGTWRADPPNGLTMYGFKTRTNAVQHLVGMATFTECAEPGCKRYADHGSFHADANGVRRWPVDA